MRNIKQLALLPLGVGFWWYASWQNNLSQREFVAGLIFAFGTAAIMTVLERFVQKRRRNS